MAQLILDDQLAASEVLVPLRRWITAGRLRDLLPEEHILDDRVPQILLSLKQATFVTIDQGFWDPRLLNPRYCILYFALRDDQQAMLPGLLRKLFRAREFRSRAIRMGKVARVGLSGIHSWSIPSGKLSRFDWRD